MLYWVYYTDGYIYRLMRSMTATTRILHSQLCGTGVQQRGQPNGTLTGVHHIVIRHGLVKGHKSSVSNPSLLQSGICLSLWKWKESERKNAYRDSAHSRIYEWRTFKPPKILAIFSLIFPPFSASGTPRSLPQICNRESSLPNYHHELSASPQRPWMWPSV